MGLIKRGIASSAATRIAPANHFQGPRAVSADAPNGIIGRAVIVHMQQDDLKTDPTGNAGARAACGVIS